MYGFLAQASGPSTDSGRPLSAPQIDSAGLDMISAHALTLLSRRNGLDKHERPSAWFLYQK